MRVGKIPWRRKWQPPPVFLPGKFHGQRSLAGYSPRGRKELFTTEQLSTDHLNPASQSAGRDFRQKLEDVYDLQPYP